MTSTKLKKKAVMFVLWAMVLSILPALHFSERKGINGVATVVKWLVLSVVLSAGFYANLPAMSAFGLGESAWWLLVVLLVGNVGFHILLSEGVAVPFIALLSTGLLVGAFELSSWPIFRASDLSANVGTVERKEWNSSLAPVDPKHIRLVSSEQAEWIGAKALSEGLGSVFHPGRYSLQKVGDRLYWVAPLDFQGWRRWVSADSAPGAILVDAQDPSVPARLVQKDGTGK